MLKDFQVDLELSPKDNRVIQTGATYWSHDVNTAKIVVNLKRNSEPIILSSTVSVRMIMVFDDNDTQKKQVHKMTIDDTQNGVVSLVLPKETLGFVGNVLCGVYVNYGGNQSTDNGYFTFSMRRSLIDGEFPQLENGYVSEFQTMLDYMIETASEFDNVEEELNKRIDIIEKDIASNEVAKQSEVDNLKSDFLNLKIGGRNYFSKDIHDYDLSKAYANKKLPPGEKTFKILKRAGIENVPENHIFVGFSKKSTPGGTPDEYSWAIRDGVHEKEQITVKDMDYLSIHPKKQETLDFLDEYYEIQFECGNIATDFTLALEDLATRKDVRYIQKQIDELKKAITALGGTV